MIIPLNFTFPNPFKVYNGPQPIASKKIPLSRSDSMDPKPVISEESRVLVTFNVNHKRLKKAFYNSGMTENRFKIIENVWKKMSIIPDLFFMAFTSDRLPRLHRPNLLNVFETVTDSLNFIQNQFFIIQKLLYEKLGHNHPVSIKKTFYLL